MTIDEVVKLLNASLPNPLTPLQEWLLRQAWEGKTYNSMAVEANYVEEYLRKTASGLWSILSNFWGESITKANLRATLEPRRLTKAKRQLIEDSAYPDTATSPEFPSSPLSINSKFYIARPPIEELAYEEIAKPGSVIRIKASRRLGKSSLILRILSHATALNYRSASIDFQQADRTVFANLDKFLRWFSINVSRELQLPSKLDKYWDEEIGSKVSCTLYFQYYLLEEIQQPIVLTLNEVNRVFEYPEIAQDFLPLLRFWHEQAKHIERWQKLRLVVAYSTEIYIPLQLTQSPFNVGLPLKLPTFTKEQVQTLAQRYGLDWLNDSRVKRLMGLVGGHPYLVQLALYSLYRRNVTLKQLLEQAPTTSGIYQAHLWQLLLSLQEQPELEAAFKQVISVNHPVKLEPILAYKLDSMGLVTSDSDRVMPSCELYRLYFRAQLLQPNELNELEKCVLPECSVYRQLAQENLELQCLCGIDELTQIANRRYFNTYLETEWKRSVREQTSLSLLLCDLDFFKAYNDTYGHAAGDDCLQYVARTIQICINRPADLVARYGGEEFAVILPHTESAGAIYMAEKIRETVKSLSILHAASLVHPPVVTLSIGVATRIPHSQSNPDSLIEAADRALYISKIQGRDRVTASEGSDNL